MKILLFWIVTLFLGISCIKAENDFNKLPLFEDRLNEQKPRIEVPRHLNRTGAIPFLRFRSVHLGKNNPALEPPKLTSLGNAKPALPPKFPILGANSFKVPNWPPMPPPPINKNLLNSKFEMPSLKVTKPAVGVASKGSKFFKYLGKILGGGALVGGGIFAAHSISKKTRGTEESEETNATAPSPEELPPPEENPPPEEILTHDKPYPPEGNLPQDEPPPPYAPHDEPPPPYASYDIDGIVVLDDRICVLLSSPVRSN